MQIDKYITRKSLVHGLQQRHALLLQLRRMREKTLAKIRAQRWTEGRGREGVMSCCVQEVQRRKRAGHVTEPRSMDNVYNKPTSNDPT